MFDVKKLAWCLFVMACVSLSFGSKGQVASDLILVSISDIKDHRHFSVTRITDNEEYSNQPYFTPSGEGVYFTQALGKDAAQTDIFYYNLTDKTSTNLTHSAGLSEYSATPTSKGFSSILVDEAGKQWLWSFSSEGKSLGKLHPAEPVGYHVWEKPETALAFVLGEPHTLQRLYSNGSASIIDSNIGPSLWSIPNQNAVSYTKEFGGDNNLWLMSLAEGKAKASKLTIMPNNVTYYTWLKDGAVLTAQGPQLLLNHVFTENPRWVPWLDLSAYCGSVSRIHSYQQEKALKLAVVCESPSDKLKAE
ncbi:hypothetical protein J3L16_10000 [Alteromonas sp. 5E99-2]|uniref:hypothetical protein n=1 Tax=Alteromonas sp. 5E99-2 TaxID=2817683 RepID=UPI001A9971C4|nr:hypothetical protein [Alteromonas sp. 5E99-2]MBO1256017.1 hypothetical protein [Alteromonas sp. 5E99-2]